MPPAWLSSSAWVVAWYLQEDADGPCGHHSQEGVTPGKVFKPKKMKEEKTTWVSLELERKGKDRQPGTGSRGKVDME